MPNPSVSFPAAFTPATAVAYAAPDGTPQLVGTANPMPVAVLSGSSTGLSDAELRASPVGVSLDAVADGARISGSVSTAAVVVSASTAGFSGGSFHVTSAGTACTIAYEQSNDNVNWVPLAVISLSATATSPSLTSTSAGIYGYATAAAFVRARVSTYGIGTVSLTLAQKRVVAPVTGVSLLGGTAALGSVTVSGSTNTSSGVTESTTALGAGASFAGTARTINANAQYAFFNASAYADQAGTLFIEQSLDTGATYQPLVSQALAAGAAAQASVRLTGAFTSATLYRVRFVNGATAQTTFRISSSFTAR